MPFIVALAFALLSCGATFADESDKPADESITVTVVGTLRTGVAAIGGETTGVTIKANGITWELEFGKNAELRKAAEALNGKRVTVQGSLERRPGVEIKERWIVTVTSLEEARLQASCRRPDSRIEFITEEAGVVIDIHSEFGIDLAMVTRISHEWPKTMLVRLHLKGLSSFKVDNQAVIVEWTAANTDGVDRVVLWQKNREQPIDEDNPYFTRLRVVGEREQSLLRDGYFELPLPARLFDGNPPAITLHWIDFYRG